MDDSKKNIETSDPQLMPTNVEAVEVAAVTDSSNNGSRLMHIIRSNKAIVGLVSGVAVFALITIGLVVFGLLGRPQPAGEIPQEIRNKAQAKLEETFGIDYDEYQDAVTTDPTGQGSAVIKDPNLALKLAREFELKQQITTVLDSEIVFDAQDKSVFPEGFQLGQNYLEINPAHPQLTEVTRVAVTSSANELRVKASAEVNGGLHKLLSVSPSQEAKFAGGSYAVVANYSVENALNCMITMLNSYHSPHRITALIADNSDSIKFVREYYIGGKRMLEFTSVVGNYFYQYNPDSYPTILPETYEARHLYQLDAETMDLVAIVYNYGGKQVAKETFTEKQIVTDIAQLPELFSLPELENIDKKIIAIDNTPMGSLIKFADLDREFGVLHLLGSKLEYASNGLGESYSNAVNNVDFDPSIAENESDNYVASYSTKSGNYWTQMSIHDGEPAFLRSGDYIKGPSAPVRMDGGFIDVTSYYSSYGIEAPVSYPASYSASYPNYNPASYPPSYPFGGYNFRTLLYSLTFNGYQYVIWTGMPVPDLVRASTEHISQVDAKNIERAQLTPETTSIGADFSRIASGSRLLTGDLKTKYDLYLDRVSISQPKPGCEKYFMGLDCLMAKYAGVEYLLTNNQSTSPASMPNGYGGYYRKYQYINYFVLSAKKSEVEAFLNNNYYTGYTVREVQGKVVVIYSSLPDQDKAKILSEMEIDKDLALLSGQLQKSESKYGDCYYCGS